MAWTLLLSSLIGALLQHVEESMPRCLFNEGQGKAEQVLGLSKEEWAIGHLELLELHFSVFEYAHSPFVPIYSAVIWCREKRDNVRDRVLALPLVKLESILLHLVTPEHTEHVVVSEELADRFLAEEDRALTHEIELVVLVKSLIVWEWISPHQVAEEPTYRNL